MFLIKKNGLFFSGLRVALRGAGGPNPVSSHHQGQIQAGDTDQSPLVQMDAKRARFRFTPFPPLAYHGGGKRFVKSNTAARARFRFTPWAGV